MKLRVVMMMVLALSAWSTAALGCGDDDDTTADDSKSGSDGKGSAGSNAGSGGSKDAGTSMTNDAGSCDDSDVEATDDELEVAGDWTSDFGDQTIALDDWDGALVVDVDNDENVAITFTPCDSMFGPGTYNKVVWTEPGDDGFYYCTVDFGLSSEQAAKSSKKTADDSDPENGGCAMFPWTKLQAQ